MSAGAKGGGGRKTNLKRKKEENALLICGPVGSISGVPQPLPSRPPRETHDGESGGAIGAARGTYGPRKVIRNMQKLPNGGTEQGGRGGAGEVREGRARTRSGAAEKALGRADGGWECGEGGRGTPRESSAERPAARGPALMTNVCLQVAGGDVQSVY